jgi:hypothetical protein
MSTYIRRRVTGVSTLLCALALGGAATPACSSESPNPGPRAGSSTCASRTEAGTVVDVASAETGEGSRVDVTRTTSSDGAMQETFAITRGGKPFARGDFAHASDGHLAGSIDYDGEAFHHVTLDGADGQILVVSLDGRPLAPVTLDDVKTDASRARFADGSSLPDYADHAMGAELRQLFQEQGQALAQCNAGAGGGLKPASEPGHTDDFESACTNCKNDCVGVFYACISSVASGCSSLAEIPVIGWALALACDGLGDIGCGIALAVCESACKNVGGACCPKACGNGCCGDTETCLDTALGTCCSAGTQPCIGTNPSCIDPKAEKCLPTGEGCPIGNNVCGASKCCAADQTECTSKNECCSKTQLCGPNCCGDLTKCIDFANGTCCLPTQACGTNCCAQGTTCTGLVGQQECCPAERACGETCCGAGQFCNAGVCSACAPGQTACKAPGGASMCCATGATCDATQCCPANKPYCPISGSCMDPAGCVLP